MINMAAGRATIHCVRSTVKTVDLPLPQARRKVLPKLDMHVPTHGCVPKDAKLLTLFVERSRVMPCTDCSYQYLPACSFMSTKDAF